MADEKEGRIKMPTAFPFNHPEIHPDGATESARLLDNRIRELRADLNAILGIPDATSLTGPIGAMAADGSYTFAKKSAQAGIVLSDLAGDPTAVGEIARNGNRIRFKNSSGVEDINFPPGTRIVFDQDTVPVGWTKDTTNSNDRVVRIVTGARSDGGSWVVSGLSAQSHVHGLGNHVHAVGHIHDLGNHTHILPNHAHDVFGTGVAQTGPEPGFVKSAGGTPATTESSGGGGATGGPSANSGAASITNTAGPSANSDVSGALSVSSTGAWRPSHRDMIVGIKS